MVRKMQVSDAVKERLNTLMRPADDVTIGAAAQGLLAVIGEERDPVAALAYVFETSPWAHWSGPETPASAFPKPFDQSPGSGDRAAIEEFTRDTQLRLRSRSPRRSAQISRTCSSARRAHGRSSRPYSPASNAP